MQQNEQEKTQNELLSYIDDASKVEAMTESAGWDVIKRDIDKYLVELSNRIPYLDTNSKEFHDSRLLFIASDKLVKMIEDYAFNKKKAEELLLKLNSTESVILADVDNG